MRNVFVSSVVSGYESYRAAARRAVTLMGDHPVMCEDFGARPYSSETACITEVERADIYLVVLGANYGYVTPGGLSVTHEEYRAAKAAGKPILAFVQDVEMEPKQQAFKREVEDYSAGFFRSKFDNPEALKDEIVKGLRQLSQLENAVSEQDFLQRLAQAEEANRQYGSHQKPELTISFLPQPARAVDIVALEGDLDARFLRMCQNGLAEMRDGYEPERHRNWTGISTPAAKIAYFDDGLVIATLDPTNRGDRYSFSSFFVPPSNIRRLATGAYPLFGANSGWCQIRLRGMEYATVKEPPADNRSSISMSIGQDSEAAYRRLLIPCTPEAFADWLNSVIGLFGRVFSSR